MPPNASLRTGICFFSAFEAGVAKSLISVVEPCRQFDYTGARISIHVSLTQVFKVFYGSQGNRIQGPDQLV